MPKQLQSGLVSSFKSHLSKKLLVAAGAVAVFATMSGPAFAVGIYPEFTINQTGVSNCATIGAGFTPCALTSDFLNGQYSETFTVLTSTGGLNPSGTFSAVAFWDLGNFGADDGTTVVGTNFLNSNGSIGTPEGAINGYRVYAVFASTGNFSPITGGTSFVGTGGCIDVYVDLNQNTTKALPGAAPAVPTCSHADPGTTPDAAIILANNTEDRLLASANLVPGLGNSEGHQFPGSAAKGDFSLLFQPFTLTTLGAGFFAAPVPFYLQAVLKGNFDLLPTTGGASTQIVGNSANGTFNTVPEPATLSLFGLGLMGMAARRRRKANKA